MREVIYSIGFCCLMFGCGTSKMNYPKTYNYIYKNVYAVHLDGTIQFRANGQFLFCDGEVYKGYFKVNKDTIFTFADSTWKDRPFDYAKDWMFPTRFIIKDKNTLLKCAKKDGKYLPLWLGDKPMFRVFKQYKKKLLGIGKGYCDELKQE